MTRPLSAEPVTIKVSVIRPAPCRVSGNMSTSFKTYSLGLIATVVALAVSVHAQADMYKGYEIPPYEVLSRDGDFELRAYESHLVAEVDVAGSREQAIRGGFRVLADFIFGGNSTSETVAMTVPVSQLPRGGADMSDRPVWTVRFMMPAAYTRDTLPEPASEAIRFVETPRERHLVVRFSGLPSAAVLAENSEKVAAEAQARGLDLVGAPRFHFYDDPFTLPWKRRNEVSVPVL
jgi:hypothetical protein